MVFKTCIDRALGTLVSGGLGSAGLMIRPDEFKVFSIIYDSLILSKILAQFNNIF